MKTSINELSVVQGCACPDLDIVTVQEAGLAGMEDPDILEWAASQNRVILTHDVNTMTAHAYRRIADGLKMTGVAAISRFHSIGELIKEILLIAECSEPVDWINRVAFLPL